MFLYFGNGELAYCRQIPMIARQEETTKRKRRKGKSDKKTRNLGQVDDGEFDTDDKGRKKDE